MSFVWSHCGKCSNNADMIEAAADNLRESNKRGGSRPVQDWVVKEKCADQPDGMSGDIIIRI